MVCYERLLNFCFSCSLIDHTVRNCPKIDGELKLVAQKLLLYEA